MVDKYPENKSRDKGKRPIDFYANAFAELKEETLKDQSDIIGEIYMAKISYGQHGQYFTPMQITDMMCRIVQGSNIVEIVSDPTCGSGRFFISMSKLNKKYSYIGIDLDGICCKMAVLNMWMFDLDADIYMGNSLTQEMSQVWVIRNGGWLWEKEAKNIPNPIIDKPKEKIKLLKPKQLGLF